jgi:hypothetical protein
LDRNGRDDCNVQSQVKPACPECGYELAGIGIGAMQACCPECGRGFRPGYPEDLLAKWPPTLVVLAKLCLPAIGIYVLGAIILAVALLVVAPLSGSLAGVLVVGTVLGANVAALVAPVLVARRLVRRHGEQAGGGIGFVLAFPAFCIVILGWIVMALLLGVFAL